eukprot:TRINITY_DN67790_c0_g9_i1.p1 TRINITY_DN67790_c0_g9~~TRINITY_DN67790_c0_g9_i1.p1  ORF type:complete len:539 (-),score=16.94 TRINITY_DN67790_c0_g9_i1:123-1625(-)
MPAASVHVTPLPKKKVYMLFGLHFTIGMANALVFPFAPFLVRHVSGGQLTQEQISFRTSLLDTAFPFGRFVSEFFWGTVSDKIGTRKTLLLTVAIGGILTFWFGICSHLSTLIFIRFFTGFISGITSVVTSAVREVTDASNRKQAMAVSCGCWCLGGMFGAGLGACYNPAEWTKSYTNFFQSDYFRKFPAAPIQAVVAALYFLSWLGLERFLIMPPPQPTPQEELEASKSKTLRQRLMHWKQNFGMVLKQPGLWHMILMFCCVRHMITFLHELFPLLTSVPKDDPRGFGLGFKSREIGIANLWMSGFDVWVSFWLIPLLTAKYSLISALKSGLYLAVPLMLSLPYLHWLLPFPPSLFVAVLVLQAIRAYSTSITYTACHTAINMHTATQEYPGAVNGLSLALGNLTQALAAITAGSLLGWAQHNHYPYPFNEHLPFVVSASLVATGCISLFWLNIEHMPDVLPWQKQSKDAEMGAPATEEVPLKSPDALADTETEEFVEP